MLDCDERNEMRERGENDDRCHGSGWPINGESIRMTDPKKRKRDLAYGIVRFGLIALCVAYAYAHVRLLLAQD